MTQEEFSEIAPNIPALPGIYKYFDVSNALIYVGKAKQLRKRVSSYFAKNLVNYKTAELVRRIHRIEFTIVNSEQDAFLLENSLIKEYQPLFNINLKDDKTYPYIVIKNEPFPRVFFTRKKIEDGSKYFGPYTSVSNVRELLEFIRQQIPLRTCKLNLTRNNIEKKKFKVCLEYHLGNCKGPCEQFQSTEDYNSGLEKLKLILKGNLFPVIQEYKELQNKYAANLEFEKAAIMQSKIDQLNDYQAKSTVVNVKTGNVDVFSILEEGDTAFVNYLAINNGSIIHTKTLNLTKKLEEDAPEILRIAIKHLRDAFRSEAKTIIVPFEVDYPEEGLQFIIPKSGDRKKLLELSQKNVNHYKEELRVKKMLNLENASTSEKSRVLQLLQNDLRLHQLPDYIECFDNSNFQGSFPVAAMVSFKNGEPRKKDYRHYNIKTVEGINDFASMKEIVARRFSRLAKEKADLPQLVIIDGGKGQLSAALEGFRTTGIEGQITFIGLAKNQEEIFFANDQESIKLPWNSESLRLIRRIRDEVHRFGITFHRNKRSKGTFKNELESISGIGASTVTNLLKRFRSVSNIKRLSFAELREEIGASRAKLIFDVIHKSDKDSQMPDITQ